MISKIKFRKVSLILLICTMSLVGCSSSKIQDKKSVELKDFKIIVVTTDNGIKMHSVEGSAWIDLAFEINKDRPQAIDAYGMTEVNRISAKKDNNLADFLFTISKTENGIALKGIKGTAWTDLSFSLPKNEKKAIDQYGMTEPK